jgi:hypothetical protein
VGGVELRHRGAGAHDGADPVPDAGLGRVGAGHRGGGAGPVHPGAVDPAAVVGVVGAVAVAVVVQHRDLIPI